MESLDIAMLKPLAAVANFTRRTITLSGVFQIKQVFKDAPTAALVTGVKHPMVLIGGIYKGFVTSLLNTDPTVQILKSAGIGGFQSLARTPEAEIKRRLGIMNRNVFDFVIKGLVILVIHQTWPSAWLCTSASWQKQAMKLKPCIKRPM
jgi:hypothetical protein